MIGTELSLDISQTSNLKTMRVFDTSLYVDEVQNLLLEVLSPSTNKWVTYKVNPSFNFTVNSSNLNINRVNDISCLADLPDGIYEVKLSYKPNIHTVVHYLHFRTASLLSQIKNEIGKLYSGRCNFVRKEFEDKKKKLAILYQDLLGAKILVEDFHEKKKGMDIYLKVKEDLKIYSDGCGC